jgi:hypothetical protein
MLWRKWYGGARRANIVLLLFSVTTVRDARMNGKNSIQALEKEIADLEYRLRNARTRLTLARPEGHRELPSNGL